LSDEKRKKNSFALKCIKEFVDDNIVPLITNAIPATQMQCLGSLLLDTLERILSLRMRNIVEGKEFGESQCTQLQVYDGCKEFVEEA